MAAAARPWCGLTAWFDSGSGERTARVRASLASGLVGAALTESNPQWQGKPLGHPGRTLAGGVPPAPLAARSTSAPNVAWRRRLVEDARRPFSQRVRDDRFISPTPRGRRRSGARARRRRSLRSTSVARRSHSQIAPRRGRRRPAAARGQRHRVWHDGDRGEAPAYEKRRIS